MSRGGGGFRGRGGMGRGGKQRIGGQEVGWDYDPEIEKAITAQPSDVFPPMENLPTPNPPMAAERESIAILLELRDRIRKGPLYTVQGSNFRVGKKTRTPAAARFDPFEGARSYSFKYKPPQRSLASFTTRQYPTKFFPDELLDVFDPVQAKKKKPRARAKKPEDEANRLKDMQENEDEENEEGGDDAEGRDPDDEGEEQEDVDDDFEDDDSDMGGDYDAEKYFDDGDNDEGDADGGDDEGGDYE